jgi:hypothetical protein
VKLLDLVVESLPGIPAGTYSFAATPGHTRNVVVFAGDSAGALLQTIAAVLEMARAPTPAPHHHLAWWAGRRGAAEARLCARWVLSEGEAARASLHARTAASEWRFGPSDTLPREIQVEGALPQTVRADLVRSIFLDAKRLSVWMDADPLAEVLAGIARRDVAATRVCCRQGVGIVAMTTPDTFAGLNKAIAQVSPALRIERVACALGEAPVACFRDGQRTPLEELPDVERDVIHLAAEILTARMRDGVVLIDRPELHVPREARARWLDWLSGLAGTNQLLVSVVDR